MLKERGVSILVFLLVAIIARVAIATPPACVLAAVKYVHTAQRPEGVWFGSWGICFTYATMFALESLSLVGETYANSAAVRRACDYLVTKQRKDGGWGESYKVSRFLSTFRHPTLNLYMNF